MNSATLLVLMASAVGPRVEVSTLSGEDTAGQLVSISDNTWQINVDGKTVQVPSEGILNSKFFVAGASASKTEPLELLLTDGSLFHVTRAHADSRALDVTSTVAGQLKIPRNFVKSLRFAKSSTSVDDAWKKLIDRNPRKDMIVVRKNDVLDFVEGVIGDVSESQINVLLDGENIPVKRDRVFGLIFYQREPGKAGSAARVEFLNGDRFRIHTIASAADQTNLSLTLAAGSTITIPTDQVKSIDFSSGRLAWLDQIKPREIKHEFQIIDLVKHYKVNRGIHDGEQLAVGKKTFSRGVTIRSRTLVRYRLDGDFNRFQAWMGIQKGLYGDVTVTISCDGTELHSGDVAPETPPQRLDLDVSGKYSLEILVDFGKGNTDTGDHLVLGSARLLK